MKISLKALVLVGLGSAACVLGGCTSGGAQQAASPSQRQDNSSWKSSADESPAEAPATASGAPAAPESAPPPPRVGATEESRAPAQRPGLGTEWGETRTSRVHDVEFARASDSPYSVAQLRYDDRAGVDALASRHGWSVSRSAGAITVAHGAIDMSLRDGSGGGMETWRAGDRWYAVGHAGDRYSIVLQNHSGHRFEAVASVDGLDVIDGKPASVGKRGYLIAPYETLTIDGFRQTEDAVAAFRFGRVADSYAAQTGSARDVGAIGVAFFSESGDRFGDGDEARTRDTADPFPGDSRYAQPPWSRSR